MAWLPAQSGRPYKSVAARWERNMKRSEGPPCSGGPVNQPSSRRSMYNSPPTMRASPPGISMARRVERGNRSTCGREISLYCWSTTRRNDDEGQEEVDEANYLGPSRRATQDRADS